MLLRIPDNDDDNDDNYDHDHHCDIFSLRIKSISHAPTIRGRSGGKKVRLSLFLSHLFFVINFHFLLILKPEGRAWNTSPN